MADILNSLGAVVPTIGKIVLYVAETPPDGPGKVWAAIVTRVVNVEEMTLQLTVFPPGEPPRGLQSVSTYSEDREVGTWFWPPRT